MPLVGARPGDAARRDGGRRTRPGFARGDRNRDHRRRGSNRLSRLADDPHRRLRLPAAPRGCAARPNLPGLSKEGRTDFAASGSAGPARGVEESERSMTENGIGIGDQAPAFELPDVDGESQALGEPGGEPATVVYWTCNHCPYALAWHDRLLDA